MFCSERILHRRLFFAIIAVNKVNYNPYVKLKNNFQFLVTLNLFYPIDIVYLKPIELMPCVCKGLIGFLTFLVSQ